MSKSNFLFHPLEISFCGYSGSGKTTLISNLISRLSKEFSIGYCKHDAHHFQMDFEGKDTWVAQKAGAKSVSINSCEASAILTQDPMDPIILKNYFLNYDFLFIEGYKDSASPKIVLLDEEGQLDEKIKNGEIQNILMIVGKNPISGKSYL